MGGAFVTVPADDEGHIGGAARADSLKGHRGQLDPVHDGAPPDSWRQDEPALEGQGAQNGVDALGAQASHVGAAQRFGELLALCFRLARSEVEGSAQAPLCMMARANSPRLAGIAR